MHGVSDASILKHTKFEADTFIAYAVRTLPLKGVVVFENVVFVEPVEPVVLVAE